MAHVFLSTALLFTKALCLSVPYQRSPLVTDSYDFQSKYFPCAPVEVHDRNHEVKYFGHRCPEHVDLEVYANIRYASTQPPGSSDAASTYSYPAGSIVDTVFPYAYCSQLPSLPWNLTYEHMRDIEDREGSDGPGSPIPEDCLTISVYRPADLPSNLSVLISPEALNSTHKRGLLPVTLIIDEAGPGEDEHHTEADPQHDQLEDEDDHTEFDKHGTKSGQGSASERKANAGLGRGRPDINAAYIVSRDINERGTGRIIVVANFAGLDKLRGAEIYKTLKAGLEIMKMTGETDTADTCRTKEEFQRLSRMTRKSNQQSANPIEWPVYGSARGRKHADVLIKWIEEHIEAFGGEPSWIQEVVILPDGAMWRTTTERSWQAKRLIREEDLQAEEENKPQQKMVFDLPV